MPGYQVKHETLAVGDFHFVIRSLLNNRQYADQDGLAAAAGISEASWPLFGLLWPAARVLAEQMQTREITGKRVLEIGCGLALASMVVHRRRGNITACDRHPLAQDFLEQNLYLNNLPNLAYQTGHWDRDNPDLGKFDLIIASDVLYERDQPLALADFIDRHSSDQVDVLIVDPDRGNRNPFCRRMTGLGFTHTVEHAASQQSTGEAFKGHLLNFSRRRASIVTTRGPAPSRGRFAEDSDLGVHL